MRFLLIRLSSIGDIVLTTPLIRALAERFPTAEIHYLTRKQYKPLVEHHPLLHGIHTWPPSEWIVQTNWDGVIDLQKNLRTLPLRWLLKAKHFTTFPKENWRKWWMVRLKKRISIPHVVVRYAQALRPWGIEPEGIGPLEVFVPPEIEKEVQEELHVKGGTHARWLAVGLGASYVTKKWVVGYFQQLLTQLEMPVILLGGLSEAEEAQTIAQNLKAPTVIGAGRYSLLHTAAALRQAAWVLSHDTGIAHLAAAADKPVAVLWGNTIPEFGMTPWKVPQCHIEVPSLPCRPCSKLGFSRCPQGHHDCMRALTPDFVEAKLRSFWEKN
ncbi:MAG: glycosyltransferase family 9 protein [Bacteroidia bacterium]|nr:glycosyltransferase family 9 protein [Bacteroidia bacterium]MDW8236674.1 glycosyltransferase family 9 protein [Bacteroidia bacterium]